jgi:hypothetical protein
MQERSLETSPTLTTIIDRACAPLAKRIEQRRLPAVMRVHPAVFELIRDLRAREIADDYPLLFLGMELAADGDLSLEGFEFAD